MVESKYLIEAENIHKSFKQPHGGPLRVLQGVDLKLKAGEKIAIMGPSGSGKSTLLHILGLMESPDQGELSLLGHKIPTFGLDEKRDSLRRSFIGFLFQFDSLIEELSVLENFKFQIALKTLGSNDKEEARERMMQWCEKFNLKSVLESYPSSLSGGEKTRANLIRALLGSPKILLADEPTGNLDHKNAQAIMEMLMTLLDENLKDRQNIGGMVVVTHNSEIAQKMDKIYALHEGKLKPLKGGVG